MDNEVLNKIIYVLDDCLDIDSSKVKLSDNIQDDLGSDSLDLVDVIMGVEFAFDIELPDDEAGEIVTVGDLYNLVMKVKG